MVEGISDLGIFTPSKTATTSSSVNPNNSLNRASVVNFEEILKPLVRLSKVIGVTPVINIRSIIPVCVPSFKIS